MAKLVKIAKVKDVPPGQAAAYKVEGKRIALYNVDGTFYATGDTCTHWAAPLAEGKIRGTEIVCPWHGGAFDLKTGNATCGPAVKPVACFRVVVEGDDVQVELQD
jgi:nitrite reductase/ring-hydroxylating ferredoxin subunit